MCRWPYSEFIVNVRSNECGTHPEIKRTRERERERGKYQILFCHGGHRRSREYGFTSHASVDCTYSYYIPTHSPHNWNFEEVKKKKQFEKQTCTRIHRWNERKENNFKLFTARPAGSSEAQNQTKRNIYIKSMLFFSGCWCRCRILTKTN